MKVWIIVIMKIRMDLGVIKDVGYSDLLDTDGEREDGVEDGV